MYNKVHLLYNLQVFTETTVNIWTLYVFRQLQITQITISSTCVNNITKYYFIISGHQLFVALVKPFEARGSVSWDNLTPGLVRSVYQGIISYIAADTSVIFKCSNFECMCLTYSWVWSGSFH